MTRRARMLLDALEDGCATRHEIWAHAGRFFLTNNAASDLRRAGVDVVWDRESDSYSLLDDGRPAYGAGTSPFPVAPIIEERDEQLSLVAT